MKKLVAILLAALMLLGLAAVASAEEIDPELIAAAKADGELIVYGS